jgi:hypothetical protein
VTADDAERDRVSERDEQEPTWAQVDKARAALARPHVDEDPQAADGTTRDAANEPAAADDDA